MGGIIQKIPASSQQLIPLAIYYNWKEYFTILVLIRVVWCVKIVQADYLLFVLFTSYIFIKNSYARVAFLSLILHVALIWMLVVPQSLCVKDLVPKEMLLRGTVDR
jgi:hypothetical protein